MPFCFAVDQCTGAGAGTHWSLELCSPVCDCSVILAIETRRAEIGTYLARSLDCDLWNIFLLSAVCTIRICRLPLLWSCPTGKPPDI